MRNLHLDVVLKRCKKIVRKENQRSSISTKRRGRDKYNRAQEECKATSDMLQACEHVTAVSVMQAASMTCSLLLPDRSVRLMCSLSLPDSGAVCLNCPMLLSDRHLIINAGSTVTVISERKNFIKS